MSEAIIRSYERTDLPLPQRLASLARRFQCLKDASGISPFDTGALFQWTESQPVESAAHQTGLLILNLADPHFPHPFNVLVATRFWQIEDRQMFINFLRIWQF